MCWVAVTGNFVRQNVSPFGRKSMWWFFPIIHSCDIQASYIVVKRVVELTVVITVVVVTVVIIVVVVTIVLV